MELELSVISAGFIEKTLGAATIRLGRGDVVPVVYDVVLPLEVPGRLESMSIEEADEALLVPMPQVRRASFRHPPTTHAPELADHEGFKRSG